MSELSQLINWIQRGLSRNATYTKTIRYPQLLLASLQELHDLIGNDKVKDAVATQVSHLIMIKRRILDNPSIKEDEVMLNTVLYGPPGVGKTIIGTKLAKIWYSLGYIDGSNNSKEKKQEIGEIIKDLFKENGSNNNTDDSTIFIYIMFIFIMLFITLLSLAWSFYSKFGGIWTLAMISLIILTILVVGYYISNSMNSSSNNVNSKEIKNTKDTKGSGCTGKDCPRENLTGIKNRNSTNEFGNSPIIPETLTDDQVIKVVTRADFVDRYVGWTSPKTNKLLEENLGKVLFVDEAYSLINGPHDEFGMEALTALNLFLSQRPKEIIVIFAGYKDLLEAGPYSVQPGLKRRFMWQFDCSGYTPQELFEIFKMQLRKKGWGLTDENASLRLFVDNYDAFPHYGGDTDRAGFFAELEHSRDFISNKRRMQLNMLEPSHISKGIAKLRENNITGNSEESTNPLANMMKLLSNRNSSSKSPTPQTNPQQHRNFHSNINSQPVYSDRSEPELLEESVINAIRQRSLETMHH